MRYDTRPLPPQDPPEDGNTDHYYPQQRLGRARRAREGRYRDEIPVDVDGPIRTAEL